MARACSAILKQHPKLAILPAVSGAILLSVFGLILFSFFPKAGALHTGARGLVKWFGEDGYGWYMACLFALVYMMTVVSLFANAALIHCAVQAHAGNSPSIRAGLNAAGARFAKILGWALIATTVGIALHTLRGTLERLGFLGDLLASGITDPRNGL
jgi:hypothetical protein